jgi:pullulanase/glycogen debranching enzyme
MTATRIWPGRPSPLGATIADTGVNFALFSEHATKVKLCLFDLPNATVESNRIALREKTNQVWDGCLPVLSSASFTSVSPMYPNRTRRYPQEAPRSGERVVAFRSRHHRATGAVCLTKQQ